MTLSDICGTHEEKPLFQVIFLRNDSHNHQSVWIDEVDEVDFSKIREHLKHGESVFIASKERNKLLTSRTSEKATNKNINHPNKKGREAPR